MNKSAKDIVVDLFLANANLDEISVPEKIRDKIFLSAAPYYLFVECLDENRIKNSKNPFDGIVFELVERCFEVISGCLSLCVLQEFQQAEILSRTIMESAITVEYVIEDDTNIRIIRYLESYIQQEDIQCKKWENELDKGEYPSEESHRIQVADKKKSVSNYKKFLADFCIAVDIDYPPRGGWPNFYDICASLGKGVDYRTVYMAMCSQSHHDAEDILNSIISKVSDSTNSLCLEVAKEKDAFSLLLVMLSIRYFLEAINLVSEKYDFEAPKKESEKSISSLLELINSIHEAGYSEFSYNGWVGEN